MARVQLSALLPAATAPAGGGGAGGGGRSVAELAEQMDRIEAAVLSLADAFGSLQKQVSEQLEVTRQAPSMAPPTSRSPSRAWVDEKAEDFDEPSSVA